MFMLLAVAAASFHGSVKSQNLVFDFFTYSSMTLIKQSDQFIQRSLELLQASPEDTTVSITYTHSRVKSAKTGKPAKALIKIKTYNPQTGICLNFKTHKAKEFSRMINVLGPRGSSMTKVENSEKNTIHLDGFSSVMSNVEFKEEVAPAPAAAPVPEQAESGGKKKSKKKGKKK
ncbi:hypothetical protein KL914_002994 [Ogataea haglerorum]|nr:hypothetical protein KL914_002994 [Ogataea haglerorum]KAG7810276.1 hypothetical protein KL924_002544 [Ogataea haglerorum]